MNDKFRLSELEPVMLEKLNSGGEFIMKTHGTSMLPMLSDGNDCVVLIKPHNKPKLGDVVLFKRNNGQFILHRIVSKRKDSYVFRGDNQTINEYGITDDMIIAVMTAYIKKGKRISISDVCYKRYMRTLKLRYLKKCMVSAVVDVIKRIK